MDASLTAAPAAPAPAPEASLAPIAAAQRIEALDVVRGFALLGIFLMNIEFFNRTFASFNEGMPRGLTGVDWLASWFVAYFVQGKFWTIFSLLFGMGFAVMLVRAGQAGRDFRQVYLRRVLALAVFGAAHFIFLWDGDILFTYAVSALMLMVVLYARPKPLLLGIAAVAALGLAPGMKDLFAIAGGLATSGLVALYLRSDKRITLRGHHVPLFSLVMLLLGAALSLAAAVFWLLPDGPTEPRLPLSVFGPLVLLAAGLSWRYFDPAPVRSLRLGVGLYCFVALAMTAGGVVQRFAPDTDAALLAATTTAASSPAAAGSHAASAAAAVAPQLAARTVEDESRKPADPPSEAQADEKKPRKTAAERAAERKAERAKRLAEAKADHENELRVLTTGSYGEAVDLRARRFVEKAVGDFAGSVLFVGIFLIGMWFVRSGVMDDTAAHLPLFRKLALFALPLGIGIGLLGSLIAMSHTPGDRSDGWGIARGLVMLGNLPACLGYVGLVVTLLHSKTRLSGVRLLAPMGRMALTNYLLQSLICALYFHGYALGHWGMPRAQQLGFVLAVFAAQLAFSHWWLSKFRYGPMEWFWRGYTYRQVPRLRL